MENQRFNEGAAVKVENTIQKNGEIINYTIDNNNVSIENNLELNLEDEELVFDVEIDNGINGRKESFDVIITEINGEDFKAAFVDQNNGTSYHYDSTEMSASVAPLVAVLISFAGEFGIKN
ncbi:SAR2788 family putative toxin [Oceanobacillus sp. M65]|uniref:SAR2788 family putative toxin n=1 Tax=Oceanobacillus sp. M65 TaxID=3457435 RepID=UPI003FCE17AF